MENMLTERPVEPPGMLDTEAERLTLEPAFGNALAQLREDGVIESDALLEVNDDQFNNVRHIFCAKGEMPAIGSGETRVGGSTHPCLGLYVPCPKSRGAD